MQFRGISPVKMKPNTPHRRVRTALAYTLAEVMISVFLISIVMVSLYAGFWSGFAIVKMSRENLRATQILVQKLEAVRIYNWSQINSNTFLKTNFVDYYNPAGTNNNTYGTYYQGVASVTTPTGCSPCRCIAAGPSSGASATSCGRTSRALVPPRRSPR